jgi:hypothetical protein
MYPPSSRCHRRHWPRHPRRCPPIDVVTDAAAFVPAVVLQLMPPSTMLSPPSSSYPSRFYSTYMLTHASPRLAFCHLSMAHPQLTSSGHSLAARLPHASPPPQAARGNRAPLVVRKKVRPLISSPPSSISSLFLPNLKWFTGEACGLRRWWMRLQAIH